MASNDPAYQREYIKKHYRENRAYYIAKAKQYHSRVRDFVVASKKRPCTDCRKIYPPYVMDFDHRPEFSKRYEMNRIHLYGSLARVKAEISKCDVVCSNCHRIRTHQRRAKKVQKILSSF